MAAGAALVGEGLHWTPIIMTAQALGILVGSLQADASLPLMVELEVGSDLVPASTFMAGHAITRKGVMRHDRPPAREPLLHVDPLLASTRAQHRTGDGEGQQAEPRPSPPHLPADSSPVFHESPFSESTKMILTLVSCPGANQESRVFSLSTIWPPRLQENAGKCPWHQPFPCG
jgi:hypothetical protein